MCKKSLTPLWIVIHLFGKCLVSFSRVPGSEHTKSCSHDFLVSQTGQSRIIEFCGAAVISI